MTDFGGDLSEPRRFSLPWWRAPEAQCSPLCRPCTIAASSQNALRLNYKANCARGGARAYWPKLETAMLRSAGGYSAPRILAMATALMLGAVGVPGHRAMAAETKSYAVNMFVLATIAS